MNVDTNMVNVVLAKIDNVVSANSADFVAYNVQLNIFEYKMCVVIFFLLTILGGVFYKIADWDTMFDSEGPKIVCVISWVFAAMCLCALIICYPSLQMCMKYPEIFSIMKLVR